MKPKILVVSYVEDELHQYIYDIPGVDHIILCKHSFLLWRIFYRALMLMGIGKILLQFRLGKRKVSTYNAVIVNEMIYPYQILNFISRRNPNTLYWYWNTVSKVHRNVRFYNTDQELKRILALFEIGNIQIYSFDCGDCKRYGFIYREQMIPDLSYLANQELDKQDIFFAGRDKGRLEFLIQIKRYLESEGVSCNFLVFPDKNKQYSEKEEQYLQKEKNIAYKQIVIQNLSSKAILDVVQEGQEGLTWRPLEAILYQKKLITNFKAIKEYEFYKANNIFILGEDPIAKIKEFIQTPYQPIDMKIISKYTFTGWLNKNLFIKFGEGK